MSHPDTQSRHRAYHHAIVWGVFALLLLPFLGTFIYSLATSWSGSVLPDGLTLQWYLDLWSDGRFYAAFLRSLLVCVAALVVSLALILPLIYALELRYPHLKPWMERLILLPFAIPPVVSSIGLLQVYADGPLPLVGTPWILIGCYFTLALPFIYRAIQNALPGIQVRELMEAAMLLGASPAQAAWSIILPNLGKAIRVAVLLSFSFLFGEFVFANLLVGTQFEVVQVYLNNLRNSSGHYTSALVSSYFLFILGVTWISHRMNRDSL